MKNQMQFYYLKLGKANRLASAWLTGDNPLQRPAAVIFFGRVTVDQIMQPEPGKQIKQAQNFVRSAMPEQREKTVMIVVADGQAWFLRPDGKIVEHDPLPSEFRDDSLWKMMPVKILRKERIADVPPVLAGINSNAYLVRGTYRRITHWGNLKAIHCTLGWPLPVEHLQPEALTAVRLLECLGSVGLETLVAKVFEAAGCFVPAYRGGTMRDVDLFAHNYENKSLALGGLVVEPGKRISIQVKSRKKLKDKPAGADYLIALQAPERQACFGADWLLEQGRRSPEVWNWLARSLSWLPAEFLASYDL